MTGIADIAGAAPGHAAGIEFMRRAGSGPAGPLLLLHGVGSRAHNFGPLIGAIPASVTVIAWNAPGYAGSTPLAMPQPHPGDYAGALLRLLDALGLGRVVLAGHSLGCLFAASFAAHYPSRVAALALLSPALGYGVAPGGVLPPAVQARIDEIEALGAAAFAAKRAPRLVHAPERKPQVLAGVQQAMAALNPPGYAQAVRALGAGDLLADIACVTAPTLVAVGEQDVVTPPDNARSAYAAVRHAAGYHEIPDAGHALPQEYPNAVAGLLMPLIEHHDA
jgi:pimeloyl-ACP methyl ester carboxylesterase